MSVWAYTWAFEQPIDKPGAKFVLVALANFADEKGRAYPSQETLSLMTGMTDRAVRTHLAWLEENGYITRLERKDKKGHRTTDLCTFLAPPERLKPQPANISARENPNRKKSTIPTGRNRQSQPEKFSGDTSVEPSVDTDTTKVVADELPHPGQWCEMLRERLSVSDIPLTRNREQRYGREFKTLLKDGITPEELDEVVDRIVQRWDETQLTSDMALRDCRNGKQTNGDAKQEKRTYKRPVAAEDQWKEGYHQHYEDYTTTTAEERRKIARQILTEA